MTLLPWNALLADMGRLAASSNRAYSWTMRLAALSLQQTVFTGWWSHMAALHVDGSLRVLCVQLIHLLASKTARALRRCLI
jgi:hypothetical protein